MKQKLEKIGLWSLRGLWLLGVIVVVRDIFDSIRELSMASSFERFGFQNWSWVQFNPELFFALAIVSIVVAIVCLYFSARYIRKDALRALIIILIPLLIYNIVVYLSNETMGMGCG